MATTEQRSGFRLPWVSEPRPGAPAEAETSPDPDSAPVAEGEATRDPSTAEATEMQDVSIPDPRTMTWPDADAAGDLSTPDAASAAEGGQAAAEQPKDAAPRPRRENLLVTGLVRAMRDAAMAAREETAAHFAEEAKARVEAIHARAAEESADLRKQADTEIVAIRDWSKSEMARIREETDQRIADRKQHLEREVERHVALVERRIEQVQGAVGEFERRMEAFFVQLMAEEDPARLARLAEGLPEAPSLDMDDLDRSVTDFPMAILDARGAAAAEAAAYADLDASDEDGTTALPDDVVDAIPDDDVARRLDAFTVHTPAGDEAVTSQLAVVGLVSVASIAGFKRALAKTHGIRSVTVASGPSGDFVFTVVHDPETDLRSAVPALEGFAAVITGDADGVLTVTATDPESAR